MYVLASCIAEKLARNKTFATLLQENIFGPLNMKSSTTVGTLLRDKWDRNVSTPDGRERDQFARGATGGDEWKGLSKIYYMNDTNYEIKEIDSNVIRLASFSSMC